MKQILLATLIGLILTTAKAQDSTDSTTRAAVQKSQSAAIHKFPEIGKAGSTMNRQFVKAYNDAKAAHDPILAGTDWPLKLAERLFGENRVPSNTALEAPVKSPSLDEGNLIANRLLAKYPKLKVSVLSGNTHKRPNGIEVDGSATSFPVAGFILPLADWDALTKSQRISLSLYVENEVKRVQQRPEDYAIVSSSAPVYQQEVDKIRHISDGAWYIASTLSYSDDQDGNLYLDKKLIEGDEARDHDSAGDAIKASELRGTASNTPQPSAAASQATPAQTESGSVTVGGYLAAISEHLLDKAVSYSAGSDDAALRELMNTGAVINLKGGIRVQIVGTHLFGGKVKVRPIGDTIELWTVAEAVR